jgi:predicted RNA-binding Zn-ribbon protein involved in translation (DUF1610 family)
MNSTNAVIFNCPECAQKIEKYSQYNDRELGSYYEENVPRALAESIIGQTVYCPNCGDRFTIMIDKYSSTVPLFLRRG